MQVQLWSECTDLQRGAVGVPCPSRGLDPTHVPKGSQSVCARPIFVPSSFLLEFPQESYFRVNAETSLPLSRPVVPPFPTAARPPAGGALAARCCLGPGLPSSGGPWWPCWCSSVVQVPGSAFEEPSSFMGEPGVQRADEHHMHVYFSDVLPLCTQYSEQYHPGSAPRCCLVLLCSEASLVPTAEPALLCVALVSASEITSPDFLVSDWRQNRRN